MKRGMSLKRALFGAFVAGTLIFPGEAAAQGRPVGACALPKADTVIHGIRLGDDQSAVRVLGRAYETVMVDADTRLAWTLFASRDSKQLLALRRHPGRSEQSFMEAEVKYGRHDRGPIKLAPYEFASGGGIKLGMTRRNVVRLLGPCFSTAREGTAETIRYALLDQAVPLLQSVKALKYYAEYEFQNGRLVRFRFGYSPA